MKAFFTSFITAALVAIFVSFFVASYRQASFGATANPGAGALYEQSIAQPLGTADANMYVTSGADFQGNLLPVNSYQCLSIDTGQPNFETICGTVTASATSGLTLSISIRGLSTQTATTSNSAFIFTHRRGADVRITDFPALTIVNNQLNGLQVIPNLIYYDSGVTLSAGSPNSTIPNKAYVDAQIAAGCSNANATTKGCVQLATAAQAAAGTGTGSTGALLVAPNSIFNATPSATIISPVTSAAGKLAQGFLDLAQAFTWTGLHIFSAGFLSTASSTFSATTTIAASNPFSKALILNNIPYAFPGTQGASSTVLMTNGSGSLSWGQPTGRIYSIIDTSGFLTTGNSGTQFATSTTVLSIPAGTLTASSTIAFQGDSLFSNGGGSPTGIIYLRTSSGATLASCNMATSNGVKTLFNGTVFNQSSVSTQASYTQCWSGTTINPNPSTSAVNISAALSLQIVIGTTPSGGFTSGAQLGTAVIIVTP